MNIERLLEIEPAIDCFCVRVIVVVGDEMPSMNYGSESFHVLIYTCRPHDGLANNGCGHMPDV